MINFAILGAGFIAEVHARNIAAHPRARLVHVVDVDAAKAEALCESFGGQPDTTPTAALAGLEVDAVIITSSTAAHGEQVPLVASACKAILCEKPVAEDLDQTRAAIVAVERAGVPASVGFNRRLDASHATLRARVRAGQVGPIEMMNLVSRSEKLMPLERARLSGGMFRDKGSHFFDLACWIADDKAVEVRTFGANLFAPELAAFDDVDTAMVTLRFAGGALCHFDFSRRTAFGYDERIEVFGADGMLESRRQRERDVTLYQGDKMIEDGLHQNWLDRFLPTYAQELDIFITGLESGGAVGPSLVDGLRAQTLADAARRSCIEDRTVKLSEFE
jgi:myo-inositol 2-dehydrogenase/D-chiro-inositol 1-dehydrogenase